MRTFSSSCMIFKVWICHPKILFIQSYYPFQFIWTKIQICSVFNKEGIIVKRMDFSIIILQFLLGILPFHYNVTWCGLLINLTRDLCFLKDSNNLLVVKMFIYYLFTTSLFTPYRIPIRHLYLFILIFIFSVFLKSLSLYLILNNFIRSVSGSENIF